MLVYRICETRYKDDPLSGFGASRYGGRWNLPGRAALYTAATPELAVLESVIRLTVPFKTDWHLLILDVNDSLIENLDDAVLPSSWRERIYDGRPVQRLLAGWFEKKESLGISVPSALVPRSRNVILNPAYPDFERWVKVLENNPFSLT